MKKQEDSIIRSIMQCRDMRTVEISIIVPVYNTDKAMLKECFDSIMKQKNRDFELIIVDDGSEKSIGDYLDEYAGKHSENTRVLHIENSGASIARNTGIGNATGKYITFIDSDDWVDDDYIDALIGAFDDSTDIVMCTRTFEYKTSSVENHFFNGNRYFETSDKKELIAQSIISGVAGTWCKVYRKSFLDQKNLRYDPKLRRTQDIIFNLYAFQQAGKLYYLDRCIYHYRMQNDSVTKKYNPKADVILTLAANEFEVFVDKYYTDDKDIRLNLYRKSLNILHEICKLKLLNGKYDMSRKERYQQVEQLCSVPIYKTAIENYSLMLYPTVLGKIRLLLLKAKAYNLLWILYRAQAVIESRRNY